MTKHDAETEMRALLQLISDEDESIWKPVRRKLLELGDGALSGLMAAADDANPLVSVRARNVLEELNLNALEEQFRALSKDEAGAVDLEEGIFLLARFAYPGLDPAPYRQTLDDMAKDIRKRLRRAREPDEQVDAVNFHLFEVLGFRGNRDNYYDPGNSYINHVLESKLGIPITLSAIYLFVCRRLGLPVLGIGMPAHFLVSYASPDYHVYIDPFSNGRLLSKHDCLQLLASFGFNFREEYLQPSNDLEILTRIMRNLSQVYANGGEEHRASRLNRFLEILENPS